MNDKCKYCKGTVFVIKEMTENEIAFKCILCGSLYSGSLGEVITKGEVGFYEDH